MKNPFEVYSNSKSSMLGKKLDWEESALDSSSFIEDPYSGDRKAPKFKWLAFFMCLCFAVILGKVFYLQIVKGGFYGILADNNRIRTWPILAPRGLIKDRFGEKLAQNAASFNLVVVPFDLPKMGLDEELQKLATDFSLDLGELKNKIQRCDKKSIQPVLIAQNVSKEKSILLETKSSEYAGFSTQKIPVRQYLESQIFSHVLGYTGLVDEEEKKNLDGEKYESVDYVGKSGIELWYEDYLHGQNGENLFEVDASGKLVSLLGENSPSPGKVANLNIDKGLEEELYKALEGGKGNKKAAAIAINPKNGQVLALLSLPGFDNNLFAEGISKDDYNKLLSDKNLPMINRAIAGTYPPGSTVKPMLAAAALEEGTVKETTVIQDRGVLVIPNQYNPSIKYNYYGWKREGLGAMTVRSAIAESSDIYFYTVAGGHPNSPNVTGMGAEKVALYYEKFNLGKVTNIDLPGEKFGRVPTPAWKEEYFKDDPILSKWYLGDTYHIAIGQGDVLATPLQVAEWTAVIANNGVGFEPQVLNNIADSETGEIIFKNSPKVLINKFIDEKNIKIVQEGMRMTVTDGSGSQLKSLSITAAGKTGTSQFDGSDPAKTHAWFTAYAPYEDPQIVITVLVEAGGEGHVASVPVVKQVLEWWAKNRYMKNN
jgi:penicillin-binding protein 2